MNSSMKVVFAVLLALTSSIALAADVTGNWTGQMNGPDGSGFTITFHFKREGAKLPGTVDGPGGDPLEIRDGKVEENSISFRVKVDAGSGDMKIGHGGTIKGNEITLNIKMEGGGPGGPGPMTLKRVK